MNKSSEIRRLIADLAAGMSRYRRQPENVGEDEML